MKIIWSVIRIRTELKTRLKKLKVHPRQSYGEIIEKLLEKNDK